MPPAPTLPKGFFRKNQARLFDVVAELLAPGANDIVVLSGPVRTPHFDDDALSYVFPENLFYYLTGINEDVSTYAVLHLKARKVTLFSPEFDAAANYWQKLRTPDDFKRDFEIDDAKYLKDLPDLLAKTAPETVYLYKGVNPYSKQVTLNPEKVLAKELEPYRKNTNDFYQVACEARVIKSAEEIAALKASAEVGVAVHKAVLKQVKAGMTEAQVSNLFTSLRTERGATQPYHNIVCAGINGSYLHYSPSASVTLADKDLVLLDAGAALGGYAADITRTFPVSGKFSQKQADLYNIVLEAQKEALGLIRAGINWVDVHVAAERKLLEGLVAKGLVKGTVGELWLRRVIFYFMPHGVGHYIGLYTHDLPGLRSRENNWNPMPKLNLRVKRVLEPGMVFTVEPGLYFNAELLASAFKDPAIAGYFDQAVITEYQKEVGGIRIEDMVTVTADGYVHLTQGLPRTTAEIEEFMRH